MSYSESLQQLPSHLHDLTNARITAFEAQLNAFKLILPNHPEIQNALPRIFCCSQFVADSCTRTPSLLVDLIETNVLFLSDHRTTYSDYLPQQTIKDEKTLMQQLRIFRRREMVRIAWRDLADWSTLDETLQDLTALAETCIQFALGFLYQKGCQRFGVPTFSDGTPMNIVVLGMGKLGAWELNYSSDIDLIFAYAEEGILKDRKQTHYSEFFSRVCRKLVKVLDAITLDGFVFRTDIRLRPFGDSGAVIMSFDGMEHYYLTQAREWERYAMIKARVVAGDFSSGQQLMAMLKPFVYRRYLDYGAFEELRSLKLQIVQELRRKDRMDNIKLGFGGIREIEFIGQAFQLIRGGQEKGLQQRGILIILKLLGDLALLPQKNAEQLISSYAFLRRVENHIQQYQDKQTHDLPKDETVRQILAYSMNFPDWDNFLTALNRVRNQVQQEFEAVFSFSEQKEPAKNSQLLWRGNLEEHDYSDLGFEHVENVLTLLQTFKNTSAIRRLSSKGRMTLAQLMPKLIEAVVAVENSEITLKRLLTLYEAVAGRNVYLSLLSENPDALKQLVKLSSASKWVCDYLARYPILFDELLDTRSLYEPLEKQALQQQLQQQLATIDLNDEEQIMIGLRQFKHLNVLRVAAADIMQVIPLKVVSDYLTIIAEVVVDYTVNYAWFLLTQKHGFPLHTAEKVTGFSVLGFGKLGGIELGYGSDLDLVFLYDCAQNHAMTQGKRPIPNAQFYGRLGQKIRHILDTKMLSGQLYEVDMRLRPNGNSGLLVANLKMYKDYLKEEAWTWEHQALVRGRFIAGDFDLKKEYETIRQRILALPRALLTLQKEVREMREKMREALANEKGGQFDIKQSKGGLADIEFMVQFGVLSQSNVYLELTVPTDNVHLIDALKQHGFFTKEQALALTTIYCEYRDYGHRQVLQGDKVLADTKTFSKQRTIVKTIWTTLMSNHSP
ncbi:MAG: bifunctional [glutamate--ammonia ligase]-adenylyl-L-tyrosine phosphorylase/[glutamate--ammonia-ligase] adenylyltransferase [Methylococcales bacterium]|nr:bifunctional [glutamate--ammonia ligase]-adenylyl-L-tyrosine phosphorylase/[glutamate--ammonia-ligase] adenylyltransferase [Methylococcales bacterium]